MHKLYTDGGSRNNTFAACAWIITDEKDSVVYSNSTYLGGVTSNVAEYYGLILSLTSALAGGITDLIVYQDSELVSRQMTGQYQVKAAHLKPLHDTAMCLSQKFNTIEFKSVPREHPMVSAADAMCDLMIELYKKS